MTQGPMAWHTKKYLAYQLLNFSFSNLTIQQKIIASWNYSNFPPMNSRIYITYTLDKSKIRFRWQMLQSRWLFPNAPCMEYLPTFTIDFRPFMEVNIPMPWNIYGICDNFTTPTKKTRDTRGHQSLCWRGEVLWWYFGSYRVGPKPIVMRKVR